jgi:hypothetical protein
MSPTRPISVVCLVIAGALLLFGLWSAYAGRRSEAGVALELRRAIPIFLLGDRLIDGKIAATVRSLPPRGHASSRCCIA